MIRQVRIELRRSNAPAVAVLLLAVGALGTASMYSFWQGQWLRLGYVHASDVFFLMPLALAGGAVLGRRDRRTRAEELMNSTGRPRWQRALPAMTALGVAVAAAHLLVLAASAAVVASGGAHLGVRGLAGPLIDVLVLVGAAWVGVAVGRLWSSPLLPPLLAAAGLVAQEGTAMLGGTGSRLTNASLMISWPPDTPWETLSDRLLLSRLVLGAGLVLAGLLLAAGRSRLTRAGAAASLAGGVAGLLLIGVPGPAGIWQLDAEARRYVCADGTPQVCVTAVNAHLLPEVTTEARRGLHALAKLPNAPTRAVELRLDTIGSNDSEQWHRPEPTPGTVQFHLEVDPDTGRAADVAERIAMGGGTRWSGCGRSGDDIAPAIVAAWLLDTDTVRLWDSWTGYRYADEQQEEIRAGVRQLRALPEPEQLRRVTALRDAAARCEPDLMPALTGRAAP
ncbi:hypothetical protein [Micromonospora aurantiaca]|uniref:ABC transporter permease n=1 Tax=Micromonospora aurantiaca (nom. illeg.) TaxID=47850 RepID=A0ABQ6UKN6_9ACTN|nr:hypothetical protein [Micromonospora aurantiaca]KAB1117636.1 hypothetical protein F6X54_07035 [Micromonospora aurantiaca]UFN97394.1 hypothetical protein LF814_15220 [Micromonospora aurantiaca]